MAQSERMVIRGPAQDLAELRRSLDLHPGWSRDREAEQRLRAMKMGSGEPLCALWGGDGTTPHALLVFLATGDERLDLGNILPNELVIPLSQWGCSAVLDRFESDILRPLVGNSRLQFERWIDLPMLDDFVHARAMEKLQAFSDQAHRDGPLSESDLRLWHDFIIRLHFDETSAPAELLRPWLEARGFSGDSIERLMQEYESSDGILRAYDRELAER